MSAVIRQHLYRVAAEMAAERRGPWRNACLWAADRILELEFEIACLRAAHGTIREGEDATNGRNKTTDTKH
jgi:hypothetical protein